MIIFRIIYYYVYSNSHHFLVKDKIAFIMFNYMI